MNSSKESDITFLINIQPINTCKSENEENIKVMTHLVLFPHKSKPVKIVKVYFEVKIFNVLDTVGNA